MTMLASTAGMAAAPESARFGAWPPRWFLDAVNQGQGMIRDGARGPQLVLALIAAVSGRGAPSYTAYATPIISDLAENLHVLAPACIPTGDDARPVAAPSFIFEGYMTMYRVEDWIRYVEYNILMEYLGEEHPQHVHIWNAQTASGASPTEPISTWRNDDGGLALFNRLISQGPVGNRPVGIVPPTMSWASQVVQDIRHFHHEGYRVGGLVQAVGTYVDSRGYGAATNWAHRQLHLVYSLVYDLHNQTNAVPPSGFNQWASNREVQLWALARSGQRPRSQPGLTFPMLLCLATARPAACGLFLMGVVQAQPGAERGGATGSGKDSNPG